MLLPEWCYGDNNDDCKKNDNDNDDNGDKDIDDVDNYNHNIHNSINSKNDDYYYNNDNNDRNDSNKIKDGTSEYHQCDIHSKIKSTSYHIIPSFFKLINYLNKYNIKFNIVFRTFGVDIERVAVEFNSFCEGIYICVCM